MTYFFDGSISGFLTAFLAAYHDEAALVTSRRQQLILGEAPVYIKTDETRAARAKARLLCFDDGCMKDLNLLLRCGDDNSEQIAFSYFKKLAKSGKPVHNMLSDDAVFAAVEKIRRVGLELHRFHGFIRFMETASGALYAPFAPDHDICDLLLPHFRARLPRYPFVLHDITRKKAAVYDGKNAFVAPLEQAEIVLSGNENAWQALFSRYYAAVNIPSRERLKQMRGYLPVRYRRFMTETHGEKK
ncbi:MAG: TIGR03915 family putative DNA repair protein [Clostridia bacterium]|nr:TIGR03915 family putative DNA repair protein [Clostridia bacterium]